MTTKARLKGASQLRSEIKVELLSNPKTRYLQENPVQIKGLKGTININLQEANNLYEQLASLFTWQCYEVTGNTLKVNLD